MTTSPQNQPPIMPGPDNPQQPPVWPPQQAPPTKNPPRVLLWILGAFGAIVAIGVVAGITIAAVADEAAPAATATATTPAAIGEEAVDTPDPEDTTPRVTYTPTTSDFTITAKITEKEPGFTRSS